MKHSHYINAIIITLALATLTVLTASCGRVGDIIPPGSRVPVAPSGVSAAMREGSVILAWTAPNRDTSGDPLDDLAGYVVERAKFGEDEDECPCEYAEAANIDLKFPVGAVFRGGRVAWRDSGSTLEPGGRYRYRIAAYNTGGYKGPYTETGTLVYAAAPQAPAGLAASPDNMSVGISWDSVEGTAGYNVYRKSRPDGPTEMPVNRAPLAVNSFRDTGLVNGAEYYYAVTALTGAAMPYMEGPPSATVPATPADIVPPAVPGGLYAVPGDGFVLLSWEPVADPDLAGYHVYRGEKKGGDMVRLTVTPTVYITYKDDSALPGIDYVYAVSALDNAQPPNESGLSDKAEATVRAADSR